ncbi:hypothetical protein QAD02_002962 [Eretmocerus hayati]|uniref:Uncharacterized protein n=1 Tax=Eretmocerus hayati TaxID=131215 RepID=A0ACC2NLK6_9HYME|nr:hypothetical protein QAD02_002962 [Eretmocerus hayati]
MQAYCSEKFDRTGTLKCSVCQTVNAALEIYTSFGSYVCFNSADVYSDHEDWWAHVTSIPKTLVIQGNDYILAGLIGMQPDHFVAYCRTINGSWKVKDNVKFYGYDLSERAGIIRIALILYVRRDVPLASARS